MYKVLLVDDEPLILAGIKTLLDWNAENCELVGDARNGKQALEAIELLQPDIVIADINMPVMDGIELLKHTVEAYPEIVFVMLTNLQEFELVRESLRFNAADYLIKAQLDSGTLRESLVKAKQESGKRQTEKDFRFEQGVKQISREQLLSENLRLLMQDFPAEPEQIMGRAGVLDRYVLLSVHFVYPEYFSARNPGPCDFDELFYWEREVVEEIAKNCFTNIICAVLDSQSPQVLVLVWGGDTAARGEKFGVFYKKLVSASSDITGIEPCILVTDALSGKEGLRECREQIFAMLNYFYLTGTRFIRYGDMPEIKYVPLGLSGISGTLKKELNGRNATGCAALLERAIARVEHVPHEKSHAFWLCTELYFTICETLAALPDNTMFSNSAAGYEQIRRLSTRESVVRFLAAVKNELQSALQPGTSRHGEVIEQVKLYVYENINKRITLYETAGHVCLSAGYLSAIYKKHCGENFMDFVNGCKIQKACELLKSENCLIGQVSDTLSFENAYYFAKIFKRYMGVTPSEYRKRLKNKPR